MALSIAADPDLCEVSVHGGATAADAQRAQRDEMQGFGPHALHALYELTAMVAHVRDEDEAAELADGEYEGHLVAHIKVR